MLNFKINEAVIGQVKETIAAFGIAYVHGCGNIYNSKENSDTRRDFTNAEQEEATYRVVLTSIPQVPETVESFKAALFAAKQVEMVTPITSNRNERVFLPAKPKAEPEKEEVKEPVVKKQSRPKAEQSTE